jgi:hypothetical protein
VNRFLPPLDLRETRANEPVAIPKVGGRRTARCHADSLAEKSSTTCQGRPRRVLEPARPSSPGALVFPSFVGRGSVRTRGSTER